MYATGSFVTDPGEKCSGAAVASSPMTTAGISPGIGYAPGQTIGFRGFGNRQKGYGRAVICRRPKPEACPKPRGRPRMGEVGHAESGSGDPKVPT